MVPIRAGVALRRKLMVATVAFLTVVDLFAMQALLPSLAAHYAVSPAAMGLAVNACTLGMAISSLAVALGSRYIGRRQGILASLMLLAVPTGLLASAPDLAAFAALRMAQGMFMAAAFTLTLAHLGEHCTAQEAAGAFAAYITGNVASNLIGRLMAAGMAQHLGLAGGFYGFALLNCLGAAFAFVTLLRRPAMPAPERAAVAAPPAWRHHLHRPELRAGFGIGFCILFAFIGTFSYVNFVLVRPPFSLGPMQLGLVYLVFLPSVVSTPLAAWAATLWSIRAALLAAFTMAALGLPLLLVPALPAVLAGLALVAAGSFLAQALATGYVGRIAQQDRTAASGLYLACYFGGGLVGSAVLGQLFEVFGWTGCVTGISLAFAAASVLALRCQESPATVSMPVVLGRPSA